MGCSRSLQGYTLPLDVALESNSASFRDRDHQLMSTILVGEVHPPRADPFDVFTTRASVKADQVAEPAEASACRLTFPS
jgi:branched-chain amino acid transport system substrate-binding protein